ncbi:uncharacterized protein EV420DRAFT_1745078 [Desarmillaria tabescens]|uniref:Uncharacterized protein n=1 Tax=Armillaria tabescens TaxID=1929756 RepID=A0AA39ND68_ARMTA|nr:uncharacterized protein EV420DRAFT_1745078 [Desarmillaria tabescens]KAK0463486.1 hypothetical protein EV420DRAFT_1745078 [Desarmillaria tabescens]
MSAPHLGPCIKTVVVSTLTFTSSSGQQILSSLTRLETIKILTIPNTTRKDFSINVRSNIPEKSMFLSNVEFDGPEQLYSLLKHFPPVKDFTMQDWEVLKVMESCNGSESLAEPVLSSGRGDGAVQEVASIA